MPCPDPGILFFYQYFQSAFNYSLQQDMLPELNLKEMVQTMSFNAPKK
jgi:hypothetical protein